MNDQKRFVAGFGIETRAFIVNTACDCFFALVWHYRIQLDRPGRIMTVDDRGRAAVMTDYSGVLTARRDGGLVREVSYAESACK